MTGERVVRGAFGVLNHTVPALAARWAERAFCTPPRSALSASVRNFLATGRRSAVWGGGETRWPSGRG